MSCTSKEASPSKSGGRRSRASLESCGSKGGDDADSLSSSSPGGGSLNSTPPASRSSLERQIPGAGITTGADSRSSTGSSNSLSEEAASVIVSSSAASAYSTPSPVRLRRQSAASSSATASVTADSPLLEVTEAEEGVVAEATAQTISPIREVASQLRATLAATTAAAAAAASASEEQLAGDADDEGTEKGSSTDEDEAGGATTPCPPSEPFLPGEALASCIFKQFVRISERRITDFMMGNSGDEKKNLGKFFAISEEQPQQQPHQHQQQQQQPSLNRDISNRDKGPSLEHVLASLRTMAEHCLPSIVCALFQWYDYQHSAVSEGQRSRPVSGSGQLMLMSEQDIAVERKDLAIDYIFCMVLIQVLEHLSSHPGYQEMVERLLNQCFSHFRHKDDAQSRPNSANINLVADMYASVVGTLAKCRFASVKKKFWSELRALRAKDTHNQPCIIRNIKCLLMGMKCLRVQMAPIEDLEAGSSFVHELALYFTEAKDKEIRHSLAGLLVEILLPVAAVAKNEVNIPAMRQIVDTLWHPCNELATKKKHHIALFPLVTCLLCVSQKQFFLSYWPYFLSLCLSHLKSRDAQMARICLDSVFRLLWVYIIRIRGEKHSETQSRLQSIVLSIFPKGSKLVIPKETPVNIFVRIINLIAQEKFDFAVKEIIFELLCINKPKIIMPERMNIGLRAFLSIVHTMQQREVPAMPRSAELAAGTIKVKKSLVESQITDDTGTNLGILGYLPQIRKSFASIIRQLDPIVGRALMLTKVDADELAKTAEERKQKLDLLKTCLSAIPRLLPNKEDMKQSELVEFLTRLLIHMDAEVKQMVQAALHTLVQDYSSWRGPVIRGVIEFVQREIPDSLPDLLDGALLCLAKLLQHWEKAPSDEKLSDEQVKALHKAEGLAMIGMCQPRIDQSQLRASPRKLAFVILRAVRQILTAENGPSLLDLFEQFINSKRVQEEFSIQLRQDRSWLTGLEFIGITEQQRSSSAASSGLVWYPTPEQQVRLDDAWIRVMSGFILEQQLFSAGLYALRAAWSYAFDRLNAVFQFVDPNLPQSQRASSLLRSGSRPPGAERELYIHLWQNYAVLCCVLCPVQQQSPDSRIKAEKRGGRDLLKLLIPLLRCEITELKQAVISGLGRINCHSMRDCLEELLPLMRDACDKSDKLRRKKRRDNLKLSILQVLRLAGSCGQLRYKDCGLYSPNGCLATPIIDFIEGVRQLMEKDDSAEANDLRLKLCEFISKLVNSLEQESRVKLFDNYSMRSELLLSVSSWLTIKQLGMDLTVTSCLLALLVSGVDLDKETKIGDVPLLDWFDRLLGSCDAGVSQLAKEAVCSLLAMHNTAATDDGADVFVRDLLDLLIDRCYTSSSASKSYFTAILTAFTSQPDFPCNDSTSHTTMLCLSLLFASQPDALTSQQAVHLFQLLYHRFYVEGKDTNQAKEAFYKRVPSLRAEQLCTEFAELHTQDLTMSVFSEFTKRSEEASLPLKQLIFKLLLPWLRLIELSLDREAVPTTCGGYGSTEASEMILNNLLVMTHRLGYEFPDEMQALWHVLVRSATDHCNLKAIIRYILAVSSLSPEPSLLKTTRQIALFIMRKEPKSVIDELLSEMRCLDDRGCWTVERLAGRPYIKYSDRHAQQQQQHHQQQQLWFDKNATLRANPAPKPLDMPAYGGYFADLSQCFIADTALSAGEQFFHCAVAMLLLGDLLRDRPELDWQGYSGPSRVELKRLPAVLHACVLAMDHQRSIVRKEARMVLLQLCSLLCHTGCEAFRNAILKLQGSPVGELTIKASPSLTTLTPDQQVATITEKLPTTTTTTICNQLTDIGAVKKLIELLLKDSDKPTALATPEAVADLVRLLSSVLNESCDWAEYGLVAGLSCASRHYAGRSLQIFRALSQPLSLLRLGDLTQRLIETVSEVGEDQYYVRELLQTLESCVRFCHKPQPNSSSSSSSASAAAAAAGGVKAISPAAQRLVQQRQQQQQQSNDPMAKSATGPDLGLTVNPLAADATDAEQLQLQQQHTRSTSYTAGIAHSPLHASRHKGKAMTVDDLSDGWQQQQQQQHSGSSSALAKRLANQADERFAVLWWITVCLLQSEVEQELSQSLRILLQLLDKLQGQAPPKLRLDWPDYPGLIHLLSRVCSHPSQSENSFAALCSLAQLPPSSVVEPQGPETSFASLTLHLLPYFLQHFEQSPQQARDAAAMLSGIAQQHWPSDTSQLTIMLLQYSRSSFGRGAAHWCRCVCRYLCDAFAEKHDAEFIRIVLQQLESWPHSLLPYSQSVLHSLLNCIDVTEDVSQALIRTVTRHISNNLGDQQKLHAIVKHLVFKSASVPPASHTKHPLVLPLVPLPEAEPPRRELPGRTLVFNFDAKAEPRIGVSAANAAATAAATAAAAAAAAASGTAGGSTTSDTPSLSSSDSSGEKRSLSSGTAHQPFVPRVRMRLVALCAAHFGARAGLPKSPSDIYCHKVIFSQSTETIDRQGSVHSSSDTTSTNEQNDDILADDTSSSDLTVNYYVNFIDDQLGFLNIEDADSPTHPGHMKLSWGVCNVPICSSDAAAAAAAAAAGDGGGGGGVSAASLSPGMQSVGKRRSNNTNTNSSSSSSDEEDEAAELQQQQQQQQLQLQHQQLLQQREPATGASLSPSSARSVSPQEEPPGLGEQEWAEFAVRASSQPADRLNELYQLWPPVVSEASERLSNLCTAVRPWLPAQLADPLCKLADCLLAVQLPFVYVSQCVSCANADGQRYVLLQLRDRFETFRASRDACLDRVAEATFSQSEANQLRLAKCLNRLCLQTVALHESFAKAVEQLPVTQNDNTVQELLQLREKLRLAKFNLGPGSLRAPAPNLTALDCLLQHRYQDAIKLQDQDQLLRIYCDHLSKERESLCLTLSAEVSLEERQRDLRQSQLQVAAALQELESADGGSL